MGDESGGGRGELESPLHMLGDAALNTFGRPGGGPARLNVNGKRPRKRPAGLGIQVREPDNLRCSIQFVAFLNGRTETCQYQPMCKGKALQKEGMSPNS